MQPRVARRKTLFTAPEAPDAPPAMLCGRCECGYVFFPAQRLGCDRCGAYGERIEIVEAPARGVLRAFATEHRAKPVRVVGTVRLDAGPAFEVVLEADPAELAVGRRVRGVLVECGTDDDGRTVVDCRFAPEPAGSCEPGTAGSCEPEDAG